MSRTFACTVMILAIGVTGCSGPSAEKQQSKASSCAEKFSSEALSNWVHRMAREQRRGTVTLEYGVDFTFDNAKRLENALAKLPGDSQQVSFNGGGGAHVKISGTVPPLEATITASSDGKHTTTSRFVIAEALCRAAQGANGTLTDISVRTIGHSLDDGKLYAQPVP